MDTHTHANTHTHTHTHLGSQATTMGTLAQQSLSPAGTSPVLIKLQYRFNNIELFSQLWQPIWMLFWGLAYSSLCGSTMACRYTRSEDIDYICDHHTGEEERRQETDSEDTLVSCCPKKRKNMLLMTTLHMPLWSPGRTRNPMPSWITTGTKAELTTLIRYVDFYFSCTSFYHQIVWTAL